MALTHAAVPPILWPIWERNLPLLRERLDHLDRTAAEASAGTLTAEDHALALSNAHKLTGSLGTFGYPAGSDLARSIEHLLEAPSSPDSIRLQQLTTQLRSVLDLAPGNHPTA